MKTVFVDVDTQIDFLHPAGALFVPGAENIVGRLGELTRFAFQNHIQIVSTVDAHSENDPEFKIWKPHCVLGTTGQKKAAATRSERPLVISSQPGAFDNARSRAADAPQIVIEKQMIDCFTNPNLRPLLAALAAERYVVYGVVTEHCVRWAAFGLLETGARVELATDAVSGLSASDEREVIERFRLQGGHLTTVERVIA